MATKSERQEIGITLHKPRTFSQEHRHKLSLAHKGKLLSETHKHNIGLANKGRKPSLETRCLQSIVQKARCADPVYRAKISKRMIGTKLSLETRTRISNTLKAIYANPIMRDKIPKRKNCHLTTIQKEQLAKISRQHWQDPIYREKVIVASGKAVGTAMHRKLMSSVVKQRYQENPALREQTSKATLLRWQNADYKTRTLIAMKKARIARPTKPELVLQTILNEYFPTFKYNGDYSLGIILDGMIPDFVNINGEREVIEMFGDYWHSPGRIKKNGNWKASELGKTMAYNSLGYKCLIIWESELENPEGVTERIRRWQDGKKGR